MPRLLKWTNINAQTVYYTAISFYLERATDHLLQSVTTVFTSAQLKQFDLNHYHVPDV